LFSFLLCYFLRVLYFVTGLKISLKPALHPVKNAFDTTFHHDMTGAIISVLVTKK